MLQGGGCRARPATLLHPSFAVLHLPLHKRDRSRQGPPTEWGAHWVQGGLAQPWVPSMCSPPCHLSRREISREI